MLLQTLAKNLEERNTKLVAALKPLANLNIDHLSRAPDDRIIWILNEVELTVGDIRQAKRVLDLPVVEYDASKRQRAEQLPPLGEFSGYTKTDKST